MVRTGDERAARRTVVPEAAGRSLGSAAVWTGVGAAAVCSVVALVAVAICWLPVSGDGNHAGSTIRAGLLTFLAALHGGVTVDGSHASWLPLGMLIAVGVTTWRAGSALADTADSLDEDDPGRLLRAGSAQAAAFTAAALIATYFARLGTSSVSYLSVAVSAPLLFVLTGGLALVRSSPCLRVWIADRAPLSLLPVVRAGGAAVLVYLASGALLVTASLVVHHDRVQVLSQQVGGGWGGVPILLLGVLAAPNAVVAGTSYLAGPGFALGTGTHVHLFGTAHGVLPAFPPLAALPAGDGATPPVVALAIATVLLAGICSAALAQRAGTWLECVAHACAGAVVAGVVLGLLGWQSGGAIGAGRLRAIGPSPWQLGGAAALEVLAVSLAGLGLLAAWRWIRSPIDEDDEVGFLLSSRRLSAVRDDDREREPVTLTKPAKRAG